MHQPQARGHPYAQAVAGLLREVLQASRQGQGEIVPLQMQREFGEVDEIALHIGQRLVRHQQLKRGAGAAQGFGRPAGPCVEQR